MAAALALALDDFLVGEHGAERGAPVDGHRRLVGEPAPEQLQEDPLRPAYVARIGGVDLPRPVVAEAEHLELALERRDVVRRRPRGMLPRLDRVLLGRQAERVPAHRVQHVVAAHAPGARHDVGGGVPLGMADVQTDAGRVGEHVEDVALGPAAPARGAECPVLAPVALPAGLDLEVVVGHILLYLVVDLLNNRSRIKQSVTKEFGRLIEALRVSRLPAPGSWCRRRICDCTKPRPTRWMRRPDGFQYDDRGARASCPRGSPPADRQDAARSRHFPRRRSASTPVAVLCCAPATAQTTTPSTIFSLDFLPGHGTRGSGDGPQEHERTGRQRNSMWRSSFPRRDDRWRVRTT